MNKILWDKAASGALGDPEGDALTPDSPDAFWVCVQCAGRVAPANAARTVASQHEHCFVNPSGIPFRIGCFERAPGCRPTGQEVAQWSWFEGFAWTIGLCASCGLHLGWRYRAADQHTFYGLILDRLRLEPPP